MSPRNSVLSSCLIFISAIVVSVRCQSECDSQLFLQCQATFNSVLDVGGNVDWTDPNLLQEQVTKVFIRSTPGLIQVCDARQQLYACLGPQQYQACINPMYFLDQNFGLPEAYQMVGIIRGLDFMCIGGLQVGDENWPCIIHSIVATADDLNNCLQTYLVTLEVDPADKCRNAQQFLDCYSGVFATECPYNTEPRWWGCEYATAGYWIDQDCPQLTCSTLKSNQ